MQEGAAAPSDAEEVHSTAPAIDLTAQEEDDAPADLEEAQVPCDRCARTKKQCVRMLQPDLAQRRCDPCVHGNRAGCNAQFAGGAGQHKQPADLGSDELQC